MALAAAAAVLVVTLSWDTIAARPAARPARRAASHGRRAGGELERKKEGTAVADVAAAVQRARPVRNHSAMCKSTVQGPLLVTDERGFLCNVSTVDRRGCCDLAVRTVDQRYQYDIII